MRTAAANHGVHLVLHAPQDAVPDSGNDSGLSHAAIIAIGVVSAVLAVALLSAPIAVYLVRKVCGGVGTRVGMLHAGLQGQRHRAHDTKNTSVAP